MQAIRVEASIPNLIVSPEISADPVKRLHDPLPATLPDSGNASVAFTFGNAGVPARSCSVHSVRVSDTGAGAEFAWLCFLLDRALWGIPLREKPEVQARPEIWLCPK
jgi:hypothetical protein